MTTMYKKALLAFAQRNGYAVDCWCNLRPAPARRVYVERFGKHWMVHLPGGTLDLGAALLFQAQLGLSIAELYDLESILSSVKVQE